MPEKYKSWSDLRNRLENDLLCKSLQGRVQYFLTAYHNVHNAYARASIRIDGKDTIHFTWDKGKICESQISQYLKTNNLGFYDEAYNIEEILKPTFEERCLYSDGDFLEAVQQFLNIPIEESLNSNNYIIKLLAIFDRRVGIRTLQKLYRENITSTLPEWVKQFYILRFKVENIIE